MSDLRVVAGASFRRDGPSELHDLARALRGGDESALEAVIAVVLLGLGREVPELLASADTVLVPMAGHLAGTVSGSAQRLVDRLGAYGPVWAIGPGPERIVDAPRATDAGARDAVAEASTLRWPPVAGRGPVLLIDDVVHTGASLEAAWLAAPPSLRDRLVALVAFRAER